MLVQCRKTGVWYNPQQKWDELKKQQWFIDQMKRMATSATTATRGSN